MKTKKKIRILLIFLIVLMIAGLWVARKYSNREYTITQYASASGNQGLIYTIEDDYNHFMIIDGGWECDAKQLRDIIAKHNNKVDAWVITHPHQDHVGAFNALMEADSEEIEVKKIYVSDFDYDAYKQESEEWDYIENYEKFLDITESMDNITEIHAGDECKVIGLQMKVFNSYTNKSDVDGTSAGNDGSLMFKLSAKKQSMLFCGDVGSAMAPKLEEQWGDELKADYIQMGHHGNGGLTEKFYRLVSPSVSFFDAPEWLMYPESGSKHTTPQNCAIMESMNCKILWYNTAPNVVKME